MLFVPLTSITISSSRQRKEILGDDLIDLANSISKNGLLHPIVVRKSGEAFQLVAGERRLRAVEYLATLGEEIEIGTHKVPYESIPCTDLGDLDPIDAFECELEENLRRVDLTWQERSEATSQLYELRRLQREKRQETPLAAGEFARQVYPDHTPQAANAAVKAELMVAKQLKDPEVAKAKSIDEAVKIIKRKEESARNAALGEAVGRSFTLAAHTLLKGDSLEILPSFPNETFDCILSDPPYGMNAENFGDSGGKASGTHSYNDSLDNWLKLINIYASESFRVAKAQAHAYTFCDLDNFFHLRSVMDAVGWECFRTPLIW